MRSTWNSDKLLLRGPLTDKIISRYAERGWYSAEFRNARKELRERKKFRREAREKRDGNFLRVDGRLVYSPLGV